MRNETDLLSLLIAAVAGALVMHSLDARVGRSRRMPRDEARRGGKHGRSMDEHDLAAHPTPPAPDAWNEQGV